MNFIAHRVNTIEELKLLPTELGVELDLRDQEDNVVVVHDPFKEGESFEEYLKFYQHGTLILNVKSERIEPRILELVKKYNIEDYFFLDSSFPMIHLLASQGMRKLALRYSEFEGLDTIENMKGKVDWVWVDCFTKLPIDQESFQKLKSWGYKICLVSPELQGRPGDIDSYKLYLNEQDIVFDAICTKSYNIDKWNK